MIFVQEKIRFDKIRGDIVGGNIDFRNKYTIVWFKYLNKSGREIEIKAFLHEDDYLKFVKNESLELKEGKKYYANFTSDFWSIGGVGKTVLILKELVSDSNDDEDLSRGKFEYPQATVNNIVGRKFKIKNYITFIFGDEKRMDVYFEDPTITTKTSIEIAILKNFKGGYTFKYQHSTIK